MVILEIVFMGDRAFREQFLTIRDRERMYWVSSGLYKSEYPIPGIYLCWEYSFSQMNRYHQIRCLRILMYVDNVNSLAIYFHV